MKILFSVLLLLIVGMMTGAQSVLASNSTSTDKKVDENKCDIASADKQCEGAPQVITPPSGCITPQADDCPKEPVKEAPPLVPKEETKKVDDSCTFFPELDNCVPDPKTGECPPGFATNEDEHCFKEGPCPQGFFRQDDDESGTCLPKKGAPPVLCPPNVHMNCVPECPKNSHESHFLCLPDDIHKRIIVIHKTRTIHISSSKPNDVVTRNTHITPDLTVGEAILGCKDVDKKGELQKSCDIMMAATFNYCQTHNLKDTICSDVLYQFVLRYLKDNDVDLKQFPDTIYNLRP